MLSLKVFLDTSILSDSGLAEFGDRITEEVVEGNSFFVSSITHFQLLWGYSLAGMSAAGYEDFLEQTGTEVAPVTRQDSEHAATLKPNSSDLLDALIAASVGRYDASIWTFDRDFLKFLPKARVHLLHQ
jgi:predicted nucleic acid-binding protein